MKQYLKALTAITEDGTNKPAAREGMPGTQSLFGYQMDPIDLSKGFPLLTTKKLNFRHIVVELLWFMRGETNVKYLVDQGVNIWNEDAYAFYCKQVKKNTDGMVDPMSFEDFVMLMGREETTTSPWFQDSDYVLGDCGKQYGYQWRNFGGKTDQLKELVDGLRKNPSGRRHIISAWHPGDLDDLALHPCHSMVQFNCRPDGNGGYILDCKMYQRSADTFLGVPYNIASYALLTHIVAKMVGMTPGIYTHTFGDLHIYDNHVDQVNEQLTRAPKELPTLMMHIDIEGTSVDSIDSWISAMFSVDNYNPAARIKGELSTGIKK